MAIQSSSELQFHNLPTTSPSFWDKLTQPTSTLRSSDKPRARLLSAMLVILFPLALVAVFAGSVTSLAAGQPVAPPAPGVCLALLIILAGYLFSRSRDYSV